MSEPDVRAADLIVVTGDHAAGPTPVESSTRRPAWVIGLCWYVGTLIVNWATWAKEWPAAIVLDGQDEADRGALVDVRRRHPTLAVLVDDAERLAGPPIEPVLAEIARRVDEDSGLVAAFTTPSGAEGRGGALVAELARAQAGLVLCPPSATAVLGVVLPATPRHPGRGLLVADGEVTRAQVAR